MKKYVVLICLCLWSMAVLIAHAGAARQSSGVIRVEARSVEVYATIYDQKGHYVDGLSRERFELFEDGEPQQISSFQTNVEALACAILLDTTGSMADALPHVKNSVSKLIDDLDPNDLVAIYTFDERLAVRQEFTTDKIAAKRAMLRTRAQGRTALFDAIAETALDVAKRPGKKVLIVLTDGDDNASILNAQAAVTRAKKVGIPLYAIAEGDATHSANLKALLVDLSERTGGTTYQANKASDIDQVFGKISQDLQHLYMFSYQPPSGPADGRWHKIDVAVKGIKDYRVRAKEGYFP